MVRSCLRSWLIAVLASVAVLPAAGDARNPTPSVAPFSRATYAWPYATGPTYGSGSDNALRAGTPGVVTTPVGLFRVGSGMPTLPVDLRKSLTPHLVRRTMSRKVIGAGRRDRA